MTQRMASQTNTNHHQPETRRGVSELVPSRQQYLDLKGQYPHAILLYRMGDFYEAFDDDAGVVARDARITLTSRNFGRNGRVPMAGIPHHALNHYLGRLLAKGHTIAIAEQLSEPGRGLVERAVTRVLTPGTVAESALLPAGENRYLASVLPLGERIGLAWVDVSTGEFAVREFSGTDAARNLDEELARLDPAECLVPDNAELDIAIPGYRTRLEHWHFSAERARSALSQLFGTRSLEPYGCADSVALVGAAGAIVAYLTRTDPTLLPLLTGLRTESPGHWVGLDAATRRNLELTRSLKTGGSRGSLLGVLDETKTPMGARALRRLISQPLRDLAALQTRQAVVAALAEHHTTRASLASLLTRVGDLERLISRVSHGMATARDFLMLGVALRTVPQIVTHLDESGTSPLENFASTVSSCRDVLHLIDSAIEEDERGSASIRSGFCSTLDAAVAGSRDTRQWLAGLERYERERTGIRSLKVGYNKVIGYYIEVTRPNLPQIPADYTRKQTIANGERFFTAPLKEAESRILAADEEIATLERAALNRLAILVTDAVARLLATAGQLAHLDAMLALAEVATRNGWVAPALEESGMLTIVGGRHPVVEAGLAGEAFIPNDCCLGGEGPNLLLVTGPNMGGKSTYLRQVALIVLLAQIGSFVPADSARIGLVDRIFTRVGAQDDLAGGASTFMVEMVETATILHQATSQSLVILDEVGRGTSTDDGLAIARAVLEDIHGRIGARTLFATHYLELSELAESLPGVANFHVAALESESEGRVIFLYSVRPGSASSAYGIQVARLAGLPSWVADRAEAVLSGLGPTEQRANQLSTPASPESPGNGCQITERPSPPYQLEIEGFSASPNAGARLAHELRELDVTSLTPREAIDWLFEWQARL